MREYSFPYTEGINKGLRPEAKNPRNSGYLTEAYNVKMGRMGAEPFVALSQNIVSPWGTPYDPVFESEHTPQIFATRAGNYLCDPDAIYNLGSNFLPPDDGFGGYEVYLWSDNSWYNANWSLADFGQYQIWCDAKHIYEAFPHLGYGLVVTLDFTSTIPYGITEHYLVGRLLIYTVAAMGGRLFLTGRVDFFAPSTHGGAYVQSDYLVRDKVFWSRAGGMGAADILRIIELFSGIMQTGSESDKPGAGSVTVPWSGGVEVLKALGNKMMAYVRGSDLNLLGVPVGEGGTDSFWSGQGGGVAALTQYTSPYPTFGVDVIREVGVPGYCRPVAGDDKRHVFMDVDGVLWTIDANMKLDRLGYEEFFYPYLSKGNPPDYYAPGVYISHDPVNDDYYIRIGGGAGTASVFSKCWLLSKNGLSEVFQQVSSVAPMTNMTASPYLRTIQAMCKPAGTDLSAFACTDTVDMGTRGIKTITGLEIGASNVTAMTANVDYKYQTNEAFTASTPKPIHRNGTVTPMIAGTDFRVRVKSINYVDFDLDSLSIRWKLNDNRMIRGLHESTSSKSFPRSTG